jgi:hypothetical protein
VPEARMARGTFSWWMTSMLHLPPRTTCNSSTGPAALATRPSSAHGQRRPRSPRITAIKACALLRTAMPTRCSSHREA